LARTLQSYVLPKETDWPMIRIHIVLSTVLTVLCGGLTASAQMHEPNFAPAQQGVIQSPKIVAKSTQPASTQLQGLLDEAIEISSRRYLVANEHSPWQIYHGLNAFRRDFLVEYEGRLIPAMDWLSESNPHFRGLPWFEKTVHGGRAHRYTEPYHFEGHPNQSLALMVMSNLPREHTFETSDGPITVNDIINNAKVTLDPREELTWTLWFLTHYLDSDEVWMTSQGQTWSIEKLVEDQIQTKVTGAACGGTHNLYALSVSRNNHIRRGGQMRGVWIQADQKIKRYLTAARSLQRPDGSFPTSYFRGYGSPKTFSEKIASSGHMMEWIVVAADQKQLNDPWIEKGIRYLCDCLIRYRDEPAECGPLYHAVSAVMLYRERLNGVAWPSPDDQVTPQQIKRSIANARENSGFQPPSPKKEEVQIETIPRTAELTEELEMIAPEGTDELSQQSQDGKLSIGVEEQPSRTKPTKTVEVLDAPEEGDSVTR
ncbi:MAG: hypothetical protein KDA78_15800, partial [Planctomycetaceae bacterium]|nr:hypothetical protein [Planctomycetaceae bacterium]